jgi:hypothetical protein
MVQWFSSPTSTVSIGSGSVFSTPALSAAASASVYTYYAAATSCSSGTRAAFSVTVNAAPNLTLSATNVTVCEGKTTTLSVTGAASYNWKNNQQTVSSSASFVLTPTINAQYVVTGTNANNCTSTATISVVVSKCTGINTSLGDNKSLLLYPNPSDGRFYLRNEFSGNENTSLEVFDLRGILVKTVNLNSNNKVVLINAEELINGIYLYRLVNENKSVSTGKLVINKH